MAGLSDDHIHYGNTKDNFWEMGETGPCGPCTEIFVDRTPDKTGGPTVLSGEDPRVMEIWNNVFIQYNRNGDRSLTPLPRAHVDTGMGLERIIQVLQGKNDNYGIDLFDPFWAKLKDLSGITYGGKYPKGNEADPEAEAKDAQLRHDIAFRVIADHIRCLTFALTDGAVPSNEGRGYVLRRILRRAVRFGRQQLELKEPFLHTLVPIVVDAMGGAFPELKKNPGRVIEIVKEEEISFGRTLDRGIQLFETAARNAVARAYSHLAPPGSTSTPSHWTEGEPGTAEERLVPGSGAIAIAEEATGRITQISIPEALAKLRQGGHPTVSISGADAFKLHDTYGFPVDLTRIMAEERGMTVDLAGYEKLMEQARELARSGGKGGDNRLYDLPPATLDVLSKEWSADRTDDSAKFDAAPIDAIVMAIWDGDHLRIEAAKSEADEVAVILDKTNFYAEMGGQVGDSGQLRSAHGGVFDVTTTRMAGGYVLHVGRTVIGSINIGDHVTATLAGVRQRTEKNHTATHLANWALREVLGEGVQQKGSLVDPEKLRFDFDHAKALSDDEIAKVEQLAGDRVGRGLPVYAQQAPQEQALKINGLRAVFGEKYPPMVRVVSIGVPVDELLADPTSAKWREYSVEFCGGTHLKNTSEIGGLVITAEESVSKGVRRIVALTGDAAKGAAEGATQLSALIDRAKTAQGAEIQPLVAELQAAANAAASLLARRRARAAVTELQAKQKAWEKTEKASAGAGGAGDAVAAAAKLLEGAPALGAGKLVVGEIANAASDGLFAAADSLKKRAGSYAVMLASANDGKVNFVAAVSDDLIAKGLKAGDWIRETAKVAGGGGGGRPQMAQAGGKDPSKLGEALEAARKFAMAAVPG